MNFINTLLAGMMVMSVNIEPMLLFDFEEEKQVETWFTINDTVMGGVSSSRVYMPEEGIARFEGTVSLENNGGFASIRSKDGQYDLSAYDGVLVRVKGDGQEYKLNIKTNTQFDSVMYQARFKTKAGEWDEVMVPFSSFKATFRGRRVPSEDPVDTSKIKTFGFMISDKQDGPFKLDIDWLKAVQAKAGTSDA